jgi:hypothetical protein
MSPSTMKRSAAAFMCVAVFFSTACTTLHPVPVDPTGERIHSEVKTGDVVRVLMADGTTHGLKITDFGLTSLVGEAVQMPNGGRDATGSRLDLHYQDIRQIDVQRYSGPKTATLVAIVAAVGIIALVLIATGGGQHSPGFNR